MAAGRAHNLRNPLGNATGALVLPGFAEVGDMNHASGAAIAEPTASMTNPADANTMDQAVFVLTQMTEANLHALENAFRDAGLQNALKCSAAYFEQFLSPNRAGVAKTRIQNTAAILVVMLILIQKNKDRVQDMASLIVDPRLRMAVLAVLGQLLNKNSEREGGVG